MAHKIAALIFVAMFVQGCAAKPNIRRFYKGNVQLIGIMNSANGWSGKLKYISVEIDMTKSPSESTILGVEISPGTITPVDNIDLKMLSSVGKPEPIPEGAATSSLAQSIYLAGGYEFCFVNGRIATILVGNNPRGIIWDILKHKKYVMPFDEQDVLQLFGTADRQEDSFQF